MPPTRSIRNCVSTRPFRPTSTRSAVRSSKIASGSLRPDDCRTRQQGRTLIATNLPYTYNDKTQRYEGKGTYTLASNHRVQANFLKIAETEVNYTFNTNASMDARSLGDRKDPENLYTLAYSGVLTPRLFLEARYSTRDFSFINAGAKSTDRIDGTLLLDQSRNNTRYWADTFCGVCTPEARNNKEAFVKGSFFLSTKGTGTHTMVFGYDNFDDIRNANNHQSGSDFRIYGTSSYIVGSDVIPKFIGSDDTTLIQYNPIPSLSEGSNFRTHSLFFNDAWRVGSHLTANLGVRWDKNHGLDQSGALVTKDAAFSPRVGVIWDPTGEGRGRSPAALPSTWRRFRTASPTNHRQPATRRRTSTTTADRTSTRADR